MNTFAFVLVLAVAAAAHNIPASRGFRGAANPWAAHSKFAAQPNFLESFGVPMNDEVYYTSSALPSMAKYFATPAESRFAFPTTTLKNVIIDDAASVDAWDASSLAAKKAVFVDANPAVFAGESAFSEAPVFKKAFFVDAPTSSLFAAKSAAFADSPSYFVKSAPFADFPSFAAKSAAFADYPSFAAKKAVFAVEPSTYSSAAFSDATSFIPAQKSVFVNAAPTTALFAGKSAAFADYPSFAAKKALYVDAAPAVFSAEPSIYTDAGILAGKSAALPASLATPIFAKKAIFNSAPSFFAAEPTIYTDAGVLAGKSAAFPASLATPIFAKKASFIDAAPAVYSAEPSVYSAEPTIYTDAGVLAAKSAAFPGAFPIFAKKAVYVDSA